MSLHSESKTPESRKTSQDSTKSGAIDKENGMEEVIKELTDMREKRDKTIETMKVALKECKDRVSKITNEVPSPRRSSLSAQHFISMANIDWCQPAPWKFITGLCFIFYLLSTNLCYRFIPPFPNVYGFLYVSLLFLNLFISAVGPLAIHAGITFGLLGGNEIGFYQDSIKPHQHSILTAVNAFAIVCLKLQQCSAIVGCSSCLKLLITSVMCAAELLVACCQGTSIITNEFKFHTYIMGGIILNLVLLFLF